MSHKIIITSDNEDDIRNEIKTNPMLDECRDRVLKALDEAMGSKDPIIFVEKED